MQERVPNVRKWAYAKSVDAGGWLETWTIWGESWHGKQEAGLQSLTQKSPININYEEYVGSKV